MTKKEKIQKLEDAVKILKTEFIGLDEILDEIKSQITTWYVTPEVLNRPVIISLWGMTGTGKSSVVKRLMELLDLSSNTFYYDCGEYCCDSISFSETLFETLGRDDISASNNSLDKLSYVFVWDEFQHARTLDESGEEVDKPALRPVWSLLDDGIVTVSDSYSWEYSKLINYLETFIPFSKQYPDIKVKGNVVHDKESVNLILDQIGIDCFVDRELPNIQPKGSKRSGSGDVEDPLRPLEILSKDNIRTILKYTKKNYIEDFKEFLIKPNKTLGEVGSWLEDLRTLIYRPRSINCSKSLVFVIGNLDEAFKVEKETNPDLDADTFYKITSNVSITDIKDALKNRFRAEQIARLGNSLIKYPTLSKSSFKTIINNEVARVVKGFEELNSTKIKISDNYYDLIYSEGVYPTQGVRPVLTTIGYLMTSYFSKVIIENEDGKYKSVELDYKGDLKSGSVKVVLNFDEGALIKEYEQPLQLGKIRNPKNRKRRYAASIHEVGHAILQTYLTGQLPDLIVSVSSDGGGFCDTYNKDNEGEINTVQDINNSVMISLGGWIAERSVFKKDYCLLGSQSDLERAWEDLSNAYYKGGYEKAKSFACYETLTGVSIPEGFSDNKTALKNIYENLYRRAKHIIEVDMKLLLETAMILGEKGSIDGKEFLECIKKYGTDLTEARMEKALANNSPEIYKNVIKEKLEHESDSTI